jgi:hypothetical protein
LALMDRQTDRQLPLGRYIPTANHPRFAALRIKSIGLAVQGTGGSVVPFFSVSLIWKSPVGDSATPALDVLNCLKGVAVSQIRVAITLAPGGGRRASGVIPTG